MKEQQNLPTRDKQLLIRQILLILLDIVVFAATSVLSLWVRLEFSFSSLMEYDFLFNVLKLLPLTAPIAIVIYGQCGLYSSLWAYAGEREMVRIFLASILASIVQTAAQFVSGLNVPRSFVLIQFFLLMFSTFAIRFSYRFLRHHRALSQKKKGSARRTMIIGAGEAGATVLRELQRSEYTTNYVVCLIDDNPQKQNRRLGGVPIVGGTHEIQTMARKYRVEEIIYAIPSVAAQKRAEILQACSKTGCRLRTLPGIYQLVNGEVDIQKIRDVQIEDLLFRNAIDITDQASARYYRGKTVLVTGGGGSIGSELCRQIAACEPGKLVIFDIYENNAYDIQQELTRTYGSKLNLAVEIGSVRDRERLDCLFAAHRPDVVFHAAAHKHVPLMEHSPCEAIKNNVIGTYNTADMAEKYETEKFILISTDKAVNPTNVMGASKRLCEMVIQCRTDSATTFAAVRFGNVLGSNGSVIPLFKRQIAEGGPITITDKRIVRYFMTIPEASQLVMEAGVMAKAGELFVLDMGKPVRILDLAVNMIKLSGLEPDVDIKIKEIGLRPGEKLYEELLMKTELLTKTDNELIFIEQDTPHSRAEVDDKLTLLAEAVATADCVTALKRVKAAIRATVPTFREPHEVNSTAQNAAEMKNVKQL